MTFRCTDAATLLAGGERFDLVLSNHVLHHLDRRPSSRAFAERVAAPVAAASCCTPTSSAADRVRGCTRSASRRSRPARSCAPTDCAPSAAATARPSSPQPSARRGGSSDRFIFRVLATAPGTAVTDVVVVGAGPVGTLLAAELARRGVDVRLLERRPTPGLGHPRDRRARPGARRSRGVRDHRAPAREGASACRAARRARATRARHRALRPALARDSRSSRRSRRPRPRRCSATSRRAVERGAEVDGGRPRVSAVELRSPGTRAASSSSPRRSWCSRAGGRPRSLVYRDGRCADARLPRSVPHVRHRGRRSRRCRHRDRQPRARRRARVVPASRTMRRVRRVGCRGRPEVDCAVGAGAAAASGAAGPGRGIRRRCRRDRDRLRSTPGVRAAAAPRKTVRHRRHRARGEPDRRSGHEPRPARRGRPRSAARTLGARAVPRPTPSSQRGSDGGCARRVRAGQLAAVNTVLGRPAAERPTSPAARSCAGCSTPPFGRGFAWAYAMGLDAGA